MQVTVYGPLRTATGGKSVLVEADPDTVGDALDAFVEAYPRAERHPVDCDGDLRTNWHSSADAGTRLPAPVGPTIRVPESRVGPRPKPVYSPTVNPRS